MKKIALIIFLIASIFTACQKPVASFTENDKKKMVDSIRLTLNNYYADIKKDGLTAEFQYLDNSKDFFWVPPGYKDPINYDSVVAVLTKNAPSFSSIHNTWDSLTIIPLSPELASYTGKIHSVMVDTAGKTMDIHLIETGTLIKRKDGWKLLNGQTSMIN